MEDKELLQAIYKAIGEVSHEVKTLNDRLTIIESTSDKQYEHLVSLISTQGLDIESLSQDVNYLVKREADNRHRITLLNKAIHPINR